MRFVNLIFIWIFSLVFATLVWTLALTLDFEGAKNIQVLQVLIWGIGRHCRFLTGVWPLDLDFDMFPGLWYIDDSNFGSILVLEVQRTSISFKSWFGALEDAGGSWLGFGILILILMWSMVFEAPMIRILALYLDLEGAKNIHVLQVLIGGFGGCWRFLTGVCHLDLDLDMFTGLWYTHFPNWLPSI